MRPFLALVPPMARHRPAVLPPWILRIRLQTSSWYITPVDRNIEIYDPIAHSFDNIAAIMQTDGL